MDDTGQDANLLRGFGDASEDEAGLSDEETDLVSKVHIPEDEEHKNSFSFKKLWAFTGPGWLMSIAYLDPGNLESDLQAGVVAGYSLIWVLWWATVMGFAFQMLALRLGVVTGRDLAQVCRQEYPKPAAYALWAMTEIAIIGSDIQEVVGSAIAMEILFGIPLWAGVLITACDTFTFMFLHYAGVRKLEALFATLIATMMVCFFVQATIAAPDLGAVMEGWAVPIIHRSTLLQAVGMLGAVIMPHNIFLHSALVQSRDVNRESPFAVKEASYYFTVEAAISLLVSFFINLAVVAVFAKGFHKSESNADIGLAEAGDFLTVFGDAARYLWAVGLLAAGQSSTMTGTFAGQYVMQGFWNLHIAPWKRTLITRSVALVPAMTVALLAHRDLDTLNEYLNVLQSIQLPFALIPILMFNASPIIMGTFALGKKASYLFWSMCLLVVVTNVYLVVDFADTTLPHTNLVYSLLAIGGAAYIGFILYLCYLSLHPHKLALSRKAAKASLNYHAVSTSRLHNARGLRSDDITSDAGLDSSASVQP